MRIRHRMPMVFSLSMIDLFCCALGCVTLLWLVNQREATLKARDATNLTSKLDLARTDVSSLRLQLSTALAERDASRLATDKTRGELAASRSDAEKLSKDLASAEQLSAEQAERLTKSADSLQKLTRDLATAKARSKELDDKLTAELALHASADQKADDLTIKLRDAERSATKLRDSATEKGDKLAEVQAKVKSLEGELESTRTMMAGLEGDKKELAGKLTQARFAVENRFEGIALTGKRVVFLVDMSGSMDLVDINTTAPNKWSSVRETLLKLYRSLPDLEKYQVILFSDQVSYVLGNDGKWLDPDPRSADKIHSAMVATKPKGNTDMYTALDAAFKFKADGLDTIYLLSDGLPNVGAGLTPEAARTMRETERSEVLSQHIRQTLRLNWNLTQGGRPKVRINTVGFFYESPDVGAFLWALARENDGSFVGMSKP